MNEKDKAIAQAMASIQNRLRHVYNQGFEDGRKAERKTGKWIDHSEDGYVECPICGHLTTCEGNIEDLHYCFWCGAKMEVEE